MIPVLSAISTGAFHKGGRQNPGYIDPKAERASYGYHESEIYSLLARTALLDSGICQDKNRKTES